MELDVGDGFPPSFRFHRIEFVHVSLKGAVRPRGSSIAGE